MALKEALKVTVALIYYSSRLAQVGESLPLLTDEPATLAFRPGVGRWRPRLRASDWRVLEERIEPSSARKETRQGPLFRLHLLLA